MDALLADLLRRGANDLWHLGLADAQIAQFDRYADLLVEWNATRMNLTRLTSPEDIAIKHFLDSLALLTVVSIPRNARVIDIGTGAGLPGLALKIARPDLHVTLLDATAKKLTFCRFVADALELDNVTILHARAEDAVKLPAHKMTYDLVVARAVAPLEKLLLLCIPFVMPGGRIAALKGAGVSDELPAAMLIARRLGWKLEPPLAVVLPGAEKELVRQVVVGRRG